MKTRKLAALIAAILANAFVSEAKGSKLKAHQVKTIAQDTADVVRTFVHVSTLYDQTFYITEDNTPELVANCRFPKGMADLLKFSRVYWDKELEGLVSPMYERSDSEVSCDTDWLKSVIKNLPIDYEMVETKESIAARKQAEDEGAVVPEKKLVPTLGVSNVVGHVVSPIHLENIYKRWNIARSFTVELEPVHKASIYTATDLPAYYAEDGTYYSKSSASEDDEMIVQLMGERLPIPSKYIVTRAEYTTEKVQKWLEDRFISRSK
jgi:hypothetical protein